MSDYDILRLTNGTVDVDVTRRVGPRVVRYGFTGRDNMFGEVPNAVIATALGEWRPLGGHRLWVAPESMPGSYAPDSHPIDCAQTSALAAMFRQPTDAANIEKQLTIAVDPNGTRVVVTHEITNRSYWPIRVAAWAISIVATDGVAVIPQPPFRSHDEDLLPARPLVQWSFTDLTDPRWLIGSQLVRVTPDPSRAAPQKIGAGNALGWCALVRGRTVYMKRFGWRRDQTYPDYGCNNEVYTAGDYLEIETLGPLTLLEPGGSTSHVEVWYLFDDVDLGSSERDQHAALQALARRTTDL